MSDSCCSQPSAGSETCELPSVTVSRTAHAAAFCPSCHVKGKFVQDQTVKAQIAVSLRRVANTDYFFCRTQSCPVVYFSADGASTFNTGEVREQVYQKEPEAEDVPVCYCFRYTAAGVREATPEARSLIVDEINLGIQAGQCACDLRNPQGSCCLGNVMSLINQSQRV